MKINLILYVIPVIALASCSKVGSDPWVKLDYAKAECGTSEAILTTAGCVTVPANPAAADKPAVAKEEVASDQPADVNDVGAENNGHNGWSNNGFAAGHGHR